MSLLKKNQLLWIPVLILLTTSSTYGFFNFSSDDQEDQKIRVDIIKRIVRSISIIDQNYYDSGRVHPNKMLEEGLYSLAKEIPEMLVEFPSETTDRFIISLVGQSKTITYQPPQQLFDILEPISLVFEFINKNYKGDVKDDEQEYAFITGMLKTLDPHSNMLTPDVFKEFQTQTAGEYGGIGIVIGTKDDELTVISPLEGTPAMTAGLKADDKIVEIDHLPTINMPLSEAVERLRGKVNSRVILTLKRKNKDPWEVNIVRKQITIESVHSKVITEKDKKMGILSVRSFQEETFRDVDKALQEMREQAGGLHGLILDLRNNPGGLLDQSIDMADRFLSSGNILVTVGANETEEIAKARPDPKDETDIPLIVLVNEGSASASEIVAGALKNNERALILGAQTFGKGSVQSLFSLRDGSSIKLTIAQYLTPGRESIQAVGITPDILVTPKLLTEDIFDIWDDDHFGESDLEEHLKNDKYIKTSKPIFTLSYLLMEKVEEESQYTPNIDEKNDYHLNLAVKLLMQIKSGNKRDLFKQMEPILIQEEKSQDKAITLALKKKNIDWTETTQEINSSPQIAITSTFIDKETNNQSEKLLGGKEYIWQINVANKGDKDIPRLLGVVKSDNPLINQREFIFGRIEPEKDRVAFVTIKVPADTTNLDEETKINFIANNKNIFQTSKVATQFREKEKPNLAYKFHLLDNGTDGSKGNGNGHPEKGETLTLQITLKNQNAASAEDVTVNLKNVEGNGVYLRKGRATVGEIGGLQEKSTDLIVAIDKDFSKNEMELFLSAIDQKTKAGFTDTLKFSLNEQVNPIFNPPADTLQVLPKIEIIENKLQAGGRELLLRGNVTDDQKIVDVMIFAGGQKIYYKASSQENNPKEIAFRTKVPIETGANVITIQARDNRKLSSYKIISIIGPETSLAADTQ